jgi:hypothetical protein
VADQRLDGVASAQLATDHRGDTATLSGDEDPAMVETVAAIASIDISP